MPFGVDQIGRVKNMKGNPLQGALVQIVQVRESGDDDDSQPMLECKLLVDVAKCYKVGDEIDLNTYEFDPQIT